MAVIPYHELTDRAFIDWDGWLWDREKPNGPVKLISKDAATWLAGYRAGRGDIELSKAGA